MNRPAASWIMMLGALLVQAACGESNRSPVAFAPSPATSVPPASSSTATVWATVVGRDTGTCIEGATVAVISGQRAGQTFTQETPCDAQNIGGGVTLTDLTPYAALRLRVVARGWQTQERTFAPQPGLFRAVFSMQPQVD